MVKEMTNPRNCYGMWFHPEAAQGLKSTAFTTRKDLQDWFAKKTGVPEKNISIAVTGGVPGYSMIWDYQTGAHVT